MLKNIFDIFVDPPIHLIIFLWQVDLINFDITITFQGSQKNMASTDSLVPDPENRYGPFYEHRLYFFSASVFQDI